MAFDPKLHRKKQWMYRGKTLTMGRSTFEGTIDEQLKAAGVKYSYESVTVEWVRKVASGRCLSCGHSEVGQLCHYTPDFVIEKRGAGGDVPTTLWIEAKGYLDGPDRTKLRAIRKQYPGQDLRLVFQRDNVIKGTKAKTRYSAWAAKYGFVYAIGKVPTEWLQ